MIHFRKEVLTFRTHPWIFKNKNNQHMFVKYSDRVVKYFEALRYLTDKYESGLIRLPQFQLQVQVDTLLQLVNRDHVT